MEVIISYVPVLHAGYRLFFDKHKNAEIWVLGKDIIAEFDQLRKDIRALDPADTADALECWYSFGRRPLLVAEKRSLMLLHIGGSKGLRVIMPDEDVSHEVAEKYLKGLKVEFEKIFLRYDKKRSEAEFAVNPARIILATDFDKELMGAAFRESEKSDGWWRQVGAVIVSPDPDRKILLAAHNHHVPSPYAVCELGDPRGNFRMAVNIECSTELHAEKALICEAAKKGIPLEGSHLYVTTFPCPPCAKAVAACGIKRCYYSTGYAMLDGESILQANDVELIQVVI